MFLHIFRYYTLLGTFLLSVGTKTHLYDILKVHDRVVTGHNLSQVPKNRTFVFLKTP